MDKFLLNRAFKRDIHRLINKLSTDKVLCISLWKPHSSWGFTNYWANTWSLLWKKVWINEVKPLIGRNPQFYAPIVDNLIWYNQTTETSKTLNIGRLENTEFAKIKHKVV